MAPTTPMTTTPTAAAGTDQCIGPSGLATQVRSGQQQRRPIHNKSMLDDDCTVSRYFQYRITNEFGKQSFGTSALIVPSTSTSSWNDSSTTNCSSNRSTAFAVVVVVVGTGIVAAAGVGGARRETSILDSTVPVVFVVVCVVQFLSTEESVQRIPIRMLRTRGSRCFLPPSTGRRRRHHSPWFDVVIVVVTVRGSLLSIRPVVVPVPTQRHCIVPVVANVCCER
jgi:hypothetical protein